jgi:predicted Zn-dependent peptidase
VPDLHPVGRLREPSVSAAVLDNGLRVLAARKPGAPVIELRLRIPFAANGSRYAARAELLAATILLGTQRRTREDVDADLATVGGVLDAAVDPQRLSVSGSVLSTGLPVLLEVLADSLTDAAYRARDVTGERDRLVELLAISSAQPSTVARLLLQQQRFGDHPAAHEMPDAGEVAAVTPASVRSLHERAVIPGGATLVLVGDLSPTRALAAVTEALGGWGRAGGPVGRLLAPPPAVTGSQLTAHQRPGAVQSQVRLSTAALERADPAYPAAQLANLVFGGYFSSRLVENIRESKGYTYSAHSSLEFWPGRAATTIAFDTANAVTAAALLETRYELGRISLVAPSDTEVESARNYALGTLANSLATQRGYASTLSWIAESGLDPSWLREHPRRLAEVTADQVAEAAATLFAPTAVTGVVVGDLEVLAAGLHSLGGVMLP